MPRSNVKYEVASQDADSPDYFLQQVHDFQSTAKTQTSFWRKIGLTTLLIALYFALSVGLTFYQQWLYSTRGIPFPLSVVACHLIVKFFLATLVRCVRRCYKGHSQVGLPWQNVVCSLAPPGIASGFDVGFSNWAISLITMSLYTMTKSTTIIFILGFALLFNLEKKSWSLVGIVVMISGGLIMFTYKSTQFEVLGFVLCLLASFSSGLRWTMAQIIMQKSKLGVRNPIDMMFHMQPWMLLAILPVTMWFEGQKLYDSLLRVDWNDTSSIISTCTVVLGGAILAFHMEITEFMVVTYTSSLTLSISGILKEICILILAFEWQGDRMSVLNFIGLLMCLGGIILHVTQKLLINKRRATESLELQFNSSVTSNGTKPEEGVETNLPLLTQKSTSLTNLLNANFSSDEEEDEGREENSQTLFNVLQHREQ
ncbi:solute carrier family 35 member C2 isoform X2 [Orussus abietinus]|nr:solute carrier family 35 member C2 isoform X2 [Orussus abietinus]XP_012286690.1 solute carrier family 35 member C2 isoform X2 [Orussus abietinus]XP_012286691.1 solute carrier family 35 member C2 isoform X2 [Orussus abietinus]XP_012286693.1 solute carrier family 35 member C2 isoform X2 [Orussus abietinus]XP_012286694.1 solute carrier family 35 member C2 isoform X2 [Orussus abietinus]XP_012286695.1 solute carrier family 35 member C2 isoform X2 [Orussus abietinus]XP_012286696.1 solute carrier